MPFARVPSCHQLACLREAFAEFDAAFVCGVIRGLEEFLDCGWNGTVFDGLWPYDSGG